MKERLLLHVSLVPNGALPYAKSLYWPCDKCNAASSVVQSNCGQSPAWTGSDGQTWCLTLLHDTNSCETIGYENVLHCSLAFSRSDVMQSVAN